MLHLKPLSTRLGGDQGGTRCTYSTGINSKYTRSLVFFILPSSISRILEKRCRFKCAQLKAWERQLEWLRRYHSPLQILSLAENVSEVGEIRRKYKELTLKHHPDHGGSREELEKIQAAYKMLMDTKSLWYLNGNSTELASHVGTIFHRRRQVQIFGTFVWITLLCILCVVGTSFLVPFFEGLLEIIDPIFFQFMLQREAIDDQERQNGKIVEHDPAKLAPKSIKRLKYPGKYLDEL